MFFVSNLCQGELIRQQELLEVQNSLLSGFHELSLRKMGFIYERFLITMHLDLMNTGDAQILQQSWV